MPLPNARTLADKNFHNAMQNVDHTRHHICVIGGGAAGAQFYKESVRRSIDANLVDVVSYIMVDNRPSSDLGRGVAWNGEQSDLLLANMRINTMLPPDLLQELVGISEAQADSLSDRALFRQRKEVGELFHKDFNRQKELGITKGIPFLHIQSNCIAIYELGMGYIVAVESGHQYFVHDIVLALGHNPSSQYHHLRGTPGFYMNPWDWNIYSEIDQKSRVGVIGLGPTAIDAILSLNERGISPISAYSRDGLLQYPRPRSETYTPRYMTEAYITELYNEIGLTFSQVVNLIYQEYEVAGVPCSSLRIGLQKVAKLSPLEALLEGLKSVEVSQPWFGILKSFDDVTQLIWHLLPDAGKEEYLQEWRKSHTTVSYGMASLQARRVADLLQDRHIYLKKGITSIEKNSPSGFVVNYANAKGEAANDALDIIINCSGIGTDITKSDNALINFLHNHQVLVPHPRGGAMVDFYSGQLLNEEKLPQGQVYSLVGSLTYGTHLLTHCLGQVSKSAKRTAQAIHKKLNERYQRRPED